MIIFIWCKIITSDNLHLVRMYRKIYESLLEWKQKYAGREAVLIDGARRVGKSWIAKEFGRREYRSYVLVDFSKMTAEMKDVFDNYLSDTEQFLQRLQLMTGTKLYPRESLVIFDEVQRYPKAREAVKWLVEDGRYDYIETGSLVSIRKNTQNITVPSEEYHLDMWPMDFEEFMMASGEEMLMDYIKECFSEMKPMGQAFHRKAMDSLRQYLIVGGMPQAVQEWVSSGDFEAVDHIKRNILSLYRNDIYQYAGEWAAKVEMIWDSVPSQLQRHEKRFKIGQVRRGARSRDFREAFFWLDEARVVNTCYAATEPSVGLKLNRDDARYKLYMADTGLLISHAFDETSVANSELYKKIVLGKLELNSGMLIENLVAQMLRAKGHSLYYYSSVNRENASENMEIDFLVRKPVATNRHNVSAIEVKSTQRYTLSSLNKFQTKFANYLDMPIVVHSGDLKQEGGVVYLPLYMAGML